MKIKEKIMFGWGMFWAFPLIYFSIGIVMIARTWGEVLDFIAMTILSTAALMLLPVFNRGEEVGSSSKKG